MKKLKVNIGDAYGNFTVLEAPIENTIGQNRRMTKCKCTCGNETYLPISVLIKQKIKSCGCLKALALSEKRKTHGLSKTRIYRIWAHMLTRCSNEKDNMHQYYMGKGIQVCDEWKLFENFYKDMGETYEDRLTIDRLDNSKGYYKDNCKWSTPKEQSNNSTRNILVTIDEEVLTLMQACEKYNLSYYAIYSKIKRTGILPEVIINKLRN